MSHTQPDPAALCRRLTYNGAANLKGTIERPHARFPDLFNGGDRLWTGMGKWTTLAAIGVENHLLAKGMAERRSLPWHGDWRDTHSGKSLCLTPLGRIVAQYLHDHW